MIMIIIIIIIIIIIKIIMTILKDSNDYNPTLVGAKGQRLKIRT
jgi:hypothetical protein